LEIAPNQIKKTIRTYAPDGNLITEKEVTITGATLKECMVYFDEVRRKKI